MKPDLTIVYRDPTTLRAYDRNSRTHSPEQIEQVKRSIEQFGFTNPVLLKDDETTIGAGHARVRAAILARLDRIPTITLHGLSSAQWRAYVIADNKLALNAGWDFEMLRLEFNALDGMGFDLSFTGFDTSEVASHMRVNGQTDADAVPKPSPNPAVRPGDVWVCGRHRVMCGDSTSAEDRGRLLDGRTVDVAWSDIPYGIDYQGGRSQIVAQKPYGRIEGDKEASDIGVFTQAVMSLEATDTWVACSPLNLGPALAPFDQAGGVNAIIVWKKPAPGLGYQWVRRYCEFILFRTERKKTRASDSEFDHWEVATDPRQDYQHGTQKPVALVERSLKFSPGDVVADLFLGSGTTLIAAHAQKRVCLGMDIDPAFVDVALRRWQEFSGETAMLDGVPYAAIAKARASGRPVGGQKAGAGGKAPDAAPKSAVKKKAAPAAKKTAAKLAAGKGAKKTAR